MRQSRKETAWKKSRKFGDIKGGRMRPKLTDNIFNRQHNLVAPKEKDETPIFIKDNPSRDFYFPVTIVEIEEFINKLPKEQTKRITHIWLRKMKNKEYEKVNSVQGCFICGSGVNLIVLHPFPTDMKMKFGNKKPVKKILSWYSKFKPELIESKEGWQLEWTHEKIKRYYLEGLLLHEIGHQMDSRYKRYWSKSYKQKAEKFADNYAFYWGAKIRYEIQ